MQTDKKILSLPTKHLAAPLLWWKQSLTLLTAPRGAGKTTVCAEFIVQMREEGYSVGGFICPAVFENGVKTGIDLLKIATGERRRLGMRSSNEGEATVGCWKLDEDVIAWGNQILAELKDDDVTIIDELGPLELEEGYGFQKAVHLLDEGRYHAALIVVRPSLVTLARLRWPGAQVLDLERESA